MLLLALFPVIVMSTSYWPYSYQPASFSSYRTPSYSSYGTAASFPSTYSAQYSPFSSLDSLSTSSYIPSYSSFSSAWPFPTTQHTRASAAPIALSSNQQWAPYSAPRNTGTSVGESPMFSGSMLTQDLTPTLWSMPSVAEDFNMQSQPIAGNVPTMAMPATDETTSVYLGHGCFWETQYHIANLELSPELRPCKNPSLRREAACKSTASFGRSVDEVSAYSGYAGGARAMPGLKVCYKAPDMSDHARQGHTEVVQVELDGSASSSTAQEQFKALIRLYFDGFVRTPMGMQRPDPQDVGAAYRSAIGLPGGTSSPLYPLVVAANTNNMRLVPGNGNENDVINTVYIMDSNKFPFYPAEQYHQFHSDFKGEQFPASYVQSMYAGKVRNGDFPSTGCREDRHW